MNTTTMTFFTIDTLQFSKRMQKAGLQKEVAEELAEAIKETHNQSVENLASKQDLQMLEQRIVIKLGSLIAIGVGVIATLIKL